LLNTHKKILRLLRFYLARTSGCAETLLRHSGTVCEDQDVMNTKDSRHPLLCS